MDNEYINFILHLSLLISSKKSIIKVLTQRIDFYLLSATCIPNRQIIFIILFSLFLINPILFSCQQESRFFLHFPSLFHFFNIQIQPGLNLFFNLQNSFSLYIHPIPKQNERNYPCHRRLWSVRKTGLQTPLWEERIHCILSSPHFSITLK